MILEYFYKKIEIFTKIAWTHWPGILLDFSSAHESGLKTKLRKLFAINRGKTSTKPLCFDWLQIVADSTSMRLEDI